MKTKKFRRIPAILSIALLVAAVAIITVALALPSGAEPSLTKDTKITFYGIGDLTSDEVFSTQKLFYIDTADYDENSTNVLGSDTSGTFGKATVSTEKDAYVLSNLPTDIRKKRYLSFYTYAELPNVVVIIGYGSQNSDQFEFGPSNSIVLEPDENGKYTINSDTVKKIPGVSEEEVKNLYVKAVDAYTVTLPASSADFDITLDGKTARLSGAQRVVDYGEKNPTYIFKVTSKVDGKTPVVGVEYGEGLYKVLTDQGNGKYEIDNETLTAGNVKVLVSLRDPITVTYTGGEGSQYTVTPTVGTPNPHQLSYGVNSFTVDIQGNATVRSEYTIDSVTAVDATGKELEVKGQGNGEYTISAKGKGASITSNVTVTVKTTEKAKMFNVTVSGNNFPQNVSVTGLKAQGTTVSYGDTLTFSVQPNAGYQQPKVTYKVGASGSEILLSPTGTTYTIPNVTANIAVTIGTPEQIKFTVSKNLPDGVDSVKLTVSEEDIEQGGKIDYTTSDVKVTLTLKDGYTNATPRMTVNDNTVVLIGDGKTRTGTLSGGVTSNLTIAVSNVGINTYTVTDKNTSSVKDYTLTFTSGTTLTHGVSTNVTFKVTPALGYTVSSVKVDGNLVNGNSSTGYTYEVTNPDHNIAIDVTVEASYTAVLEASYNDKGQIVWTATLTFKGELAKTSYKVVGVGFFYGQDTDAIGDKGWNDYKTHGYVDRFDVTEEGKYAFVDGTNSRVAYFSHAIEDGEYNDPTFTFEYRVADANTSRSAVLYFTIVIDGQRTTIFTNVATYPGN